MAHLLLNLLKGPLIENMFHSLFTVKFAQLKEVFYIHPIPIFISYDLNTVSPIKNHKFVFIIP